MSRPFGLSQAQPSIGTSAARPTMNVNPFENGRGQTTTNQPPPPPRAQKQDTQYVRAIADYVAMEDNELAFMQGATFVLLRKDPSGWWYGEHKAKVGWFSPDFVEVLPSGYIPPFFQASQNSPIVSPMSPPKRQTRILDKESVKAHLKAMGSESVTSTPFLPNRSQQGPTPTQPAEPVKPNVYTPPANAAIHKFDRRIASPFIQTDGSTQPSVLGLKQDDSQTRDENHVVITVSPVPDPMTSNRSGLAEKPSSNIGQAAKQQAASRTLLSPRRQISPPNKKRQPPLRRAPPPPPLIFEGKQYGQVWYNFASASADELTVNEGDIVQILTREGEWCDVDFQGKVGWIPATYIKLIPSNKLGDQPPLSPAIAKREEPPQSTTPSGIQMQQNTPAPFARDVKAPTAFNQPALATQPKIPSNPTVNAFSQPQHQKALTPSAKANSGKSPVKANPPKASNIADSTLVSLDNIERKGAPLLPPSRPQAAGRRAPTQAMRPVQDLVNMMDIPIPENDPTPPTTTSNDRSAPFSPRMQGPRMPVGAGPNMGELHAALAKRQGSANDGFGSSPGEPSQQKPMGLQAAISPRGLVPRANLPPPPPGPQGPGVPPRTAAPFAAASSNGRENQLTSSSIPTAPTRPAPVPTQLQTSDVRARLGQKQGVSAAPTSEPDIGKFLTVVYMFNGAGAHELSLNVGDTVKLRSKHVSGWWYGDKDLKSGWFPCGFVKPK